MTEKDRQAIALEQDQQVRRCQVATENRLASQMPVETPDIAFWIRSEGTSWRLLNHNGISPDLNSAFNAVKAIYLHSPHS